MTFDDHLAELVEQAVARALAAWTPPAAPAAPVREDGPQLLKVREAAKKLAVAESSVWNLLRSQKIPSIKVLGATRIDERDLDVFINAARGPLDAR